MGSKIIYRNNTQTAPIYTNIYEKAKNDVSNINKTIEKLINNKINANRAWIALGVTKIKDNNKKKITIYTVVILNAYTNCF